MSSPELETALRAVVRELHWLLRSDAALCTHVDPQTRELRMLTGIGTLTDGIAGYEVKAGQSVTGLVLKERRSVRSDDYLTDPRFARSPSVEAWARAEGIVSIIGAPILDATGEIIAFLWAFNNLMAVVLGRAQLLLMKNPDAPTATGLRSIERAATDAAETVIRIQSFSRTAKRGEAVSFDLNAAVQESIEFTRSRWQDEAQVKGAPIDVAFERGSPPAISGRSAEIREVMTNLILNAVDALPEGGRIAVRTRAEPGRAVVSVNDSGIGMSVDVKRRAFEPFFTTKGVKRTGLGLAVAYGTIRRHGGQVEVESEEGRGTTVTFWLPVDGPGPPGDGPSLERLGSILIIDDEADVRELLADVLAGRGHNVTVAGGGREGLARFETGRYDLVLTDLGMPDLNGWEVARAVKASRPDVPVLLLTGWADAVSPADVPRVEGIIKKPFDLKQLAAAVSDALVASAQGPRS